MIERIKTLVKNINYLSKHNLWEQRENDIIYLSNKILDDGIYEYSLSFQQYNKLKILDKEMSIQKVIDEQKSFVRFGDGEIKLMQGYGQPFQKYEKEIVERLYGLLNKPREDILVGINRNYYVPHFRAKANDYNRRHAYDFRRFFDEHCEPNSIYLDATFTFNHVLGYSEDEITRNFWKKWKAVFRNKKLVIICGERLMEDYEYNIFEEAMSIKYIYGPRKNAWDKHDEIISKIVKEDKEQILVFILGMAGKAIIPEVTDLGYIAWDIGHLAKGYNAYMTGLDGSIAKNVAKFYAPD